MVFGVSFFAKAILEKAKKNNKKDFPDINELKEGIVIGKKGKGWGVEQLIDKTGYLKGSKDSSTGVEFTDEILAFQKKFKKSGSKKEYSEETVLYEGTLSGSAATDVNHSIPGEYKNILGISVMISNDAKTEWHTISTPFYITDTQFKFTGVGAGYRDGDYRIFLTLRSGTLRRTM